MSVDMPDFFIETEVKGMTIDPYTGTPIILLRDIAGIRTFPIWIGILEATSIASELQNIKFPRPMTHDLVSNIIRELGVGIIKVEVTDLVDNTFFAKIHLKKGRKITIVDSRPSDAIAIALRSRCPIFVSERVMEMARMVDMTVRSVSEKDNQHDILGRLSPEDFGKYKM